MVSLLRTNKLLDETEGILDTPDPELVYGPFDRESLLARMNEIQSPRERLLLLFRSTFHPQDEPTHEAYVIRRLVFVSAFAGLFCGGFLRTGDAHQEYVRRHNADIFDSKYRGNRHFWDQLLVTVAHRGLGFAFKTSLLTGTAGFISFGSIAYRNELYLPDWLVGFGTLGGLSRLWLGSRAVAVGSLIGATGGLIGYSFAKCTEFAFGKSVAELRYLNHVDWSKRNDSLFRRRQIYADQRTKQYIENIQKGEDGAEDILNP